MTALLLLGIVTRPMGYKKSERSAAQIVEAAIRVLARQGYARSSLMDIAKEAGMSKGAVHYHFPTKEALISVVLSTALRTVQEKTLEAWGTGDTPFQSVRSSIDALWAIRAQKTDEALVIADLLAQSLYDDGLRPQLADYYRFAADQMRQHVMSHVLALGLKPRVDPELLPRIVLGLLDGLVMQTFVDDEALDRDKLVAGLEQVIMSLFEFPTA